AGFALHLDERGVPAFVLGDGRGRVLRFAGARPLRARQWALLSVTFDPATGRVRIEQTPRPDSAAERLVARAGCAESTHESVELPGRPMPIVFAAWRAGEDARGPIHGAHFDGRLEAPRILATALP